MKTPSAKIFSFLYYFIPRYIFLLKKKEPPRGELLCFSVLFDVREIETISYTMSNWREDSCSLNCGAINPEIRKTNPTKERQDISFFLFL